MPSRERPSEAGRQRGARLRAETVRGLRLARRSCGLSQHAVARAVGISQSQLGRIERAEADPGIVVLATIARVVGLDLAVNLYPAGPPLRDAGHAKLLARLQSRLPESYVWRTEMPLPAPGDPRAIDAMIIVPRIDAGFELESKLLDGQEVSRRVLLKQRDAGLQAMVLVLADTVANRAALAAASTLRSAFPLGPREVLAALRSGITQRQWNSAGVGIARRSRAP